MAHQKRADRKGSLEPLGWRWEVGPADLFYLDPFCKESFPFLSAVAFPESGAVVPASPVPVLMPLSKQRGDLLTQQA